LLAISVHLRSKTIFQGGSLQWGRVRATFDEFEPDAGMSSIVILNQLGEEAEAKDENISIPTTPSSPRSIARTSFAAVPAWVIVFRA
jgi:hypothetical protein